MEHEPTPETNITPNNKNESLESKRKNFNTYLYYQGPAPQDYDEEDPPEGVSEIYYMSGDLSLKAWVSDDSLDGEKHPAVVYIHGGFAFGSPDWYDAEAYLDAGYVLMTPTLRGENGNPGNYELLYGEVADAIAAGEYLKTLSYVDPKRIFLSGHSTGGGIAMLASMLPSPYKAIATFGATCDNDVTFNNEWIDIVPFDFENPFETDLRNPMTNLDSIQTPLYVYIGRQETGLLNESKSFVNAAKKLGKTCEFIQMKGDHFDSLYPAIKDSIKKFK